jgi:hypothetical protein
MMGKETPETCWATHKHQVINLWNCCILLVELFESCATTFCLVPQHFNRSPYKLHLETPFMYLSKFFVYKYLFRG